MDENLKMRIGSAYPTGIFYEQADSILESEERDDRLRQVLQRITNKLPLSLACERYKPQLAYEMTITPCENPPFNVWVWEMRNPQKLDWIKKNNGQPYVVLWVRISRVADYYYFHYNHWVPRGDTGYLDADFARKPNDLWRSYEEVVTEELDRAFFTHCSNELAREKVPFVLDRDYDSIPEDDPRWDDDWFEPPFEPVCVHQCLFGE